MCNKLLKWVKLHVSALGIGHHQVVLRLIEQLCNRKSILGGSGGGKDLIHTPLPPVYSAYCIVAR